MLIELVAGQKAPGMWQLSLRVEKRPALAAPVIEAA